jgi:hypothetical protein
MPIRIFPRFQSKSARCRWYPKSGYQRKDLYKKSTAKSTSYVKYGIFRYEPFKIKTAAKNKLEPHFAVKPKYRSEVESWSRRPTVKLQSHVALSHVVAMRLNISSKHR